MTEALKKFVPSVSGWHQWDFLWSDLNWLDFAWIKVETEDDKMFGNFEVNLGLLGVGVMFTWDYADTEASKRIAESVRAISEAEG